MVSRKILGLNTTGYNTSAVLLVDGEPIFAVQEERLNREKLTRQFAKRCASLALPSKTLTLWQSAGIHLSILRRSTDRFRTAIATSGKTSTVFQTSL